jgi:hypothetical protein
VSNEAARIRMFRQRAQEIRSIAKDIGDASCRASLIQMAEYYERLAAGLEAKRKGSAPPPKRH